MSADTAQLPRTSPGGTLPAPGLAVGVAGWMLHDEDRVLVRPDLGLFGVFDGVGGGGRGAAAAATAAAAVERHVDEAARRPPGVDPVGVLHHALALADTAVGRLARSHGREQPATTATVTLLRTTTDGGGGGGGGEAFVAHLGDSRLQLVRTGVMRTVTLDHGLFGDEESPDARARQDRLDRAYGLADLGDPMDRAAFLRRNLLSSALTGGGTGALRTYRVPLRPGDRLALDSDGVHDNLTGSELAALLMRAGAQESADAVAAAALQRSTGGGRAKPDDISVLVLDLGRGAVRPG